ncbi:hypothetical protein McanMca71_002959 [Microsporum canis]
MGIRDADEGDECMGRPQVSRQGEELAHDEPYLIRDGNYQEVVLHTAEHVREFLRNDAKGIDSACPEQFHGGTGFANAV